MGALLEMLDHTVGHALCAERLSELLAVGDELFGQLSGQDFAENLKGGKGGYICIIFLIFLLFCPATVPLLSRQLSRYCPTLVCAVLKMLIITDGYEQNTCPAF